MAVVCFSEFTSIAGVDYLVEIWGNATGTSPATAYNLCKNRVQAAGGYFEGDQCLIDSLAALAGTTQLTAAGEGFDIQRQGESDTFFDNPIRASRANAYFIAGTDAELALFTDIATDPEQVYALKIYRNYTPIFIGRVLADQMRFERAAPEGNMIIEVAAVDILNLLQNYTVQESWFTDEHINGVDLFLNCLALTELDDYFATADNYLFDGLRQYEDSTQALSDEKLNTFWFNRLAFVNSFDVFGGIQLQYISAFDALRNVLDGFGARMHHENGAYYITQSAAYQSATLVFHRYTKAGVYNSTQTVTHGKGLASLPARPQWAAKPSLYYQPPFRLARVDFTEQNGVYVKKDLFTTTVLTLNFDRPLQDYNFRVQINLESAKLSSKNARHALSYRIYGVDGSPTALYYYYTGTEWNSMTTLPNFFNVQYAPSGDGVFGIPMTFVRDYIGPINSGPASNIVGFVVEVKVIEQILPLVIGPVPVGPVIPSWATPTTNNISFIGAIAVSRSYNQYTPGQADVFKQNRIATSENGLSGNSIPKQLSNVFYDGKDETESGTIMVGSSFASAIAPVNWAVGWQAGYTNTFQQVLVDQAVALYSDFRKVVRGTWVDNGTLTAINSLDFDSLVWLLNGVQWSARSEVWQGEWVSVAAAYDDVIEVNEGENYRPSERVYFEDQIEQLRARVNQLEETTGALPTQLINQFVADADGAPQSDPGADGTYTVAMFYDYSETTFNWQMRQMGKSLNVTSDITTFPIEYEIFVCDTNAGSITIDLPAPPSVTPGLRFGFVKTNANHSLILDAGAGYQINDAQLLSWNSRFETYWVQSDGTQWYIVASNK